MEVVIAIVVLVIGAGVWLLRRRPADRPLARSPASRPAGAKRQAARAPYQAVSIMTPRSCCQPAATMEGRKFLVPEAPRLPLSECDLESCKCGYIRHQDRRDEDHERRGPPGLKSELYALESGEDRRAARGRRWSDYSMA